MKVHTSSRLYRYATLAPFMPQIKNGCGLLLGSLLTTLYFLLSLVFFSAAISGIGGFICYILLGVPEPEAPVEEIALGFVVGCATITAVGIAVFLISLLCRRVEVVSD